mgnify:CR=1 FL=1
MEDVSYQMMYGVSRLTKEKEKVSGDNYVCRQEDGGRFGYVPFWTAWAQEWSVSGKRECGRNSGTVS